MRKDTAHTIKVTDHKGEIQPDSEQRHSKTKRTTQDGNKIRRNKISSSTNCKDNN